MKATEAKKVNRWMTFIHRAITIVLALITGTGLVKNDGAQKALEFTKEATVIGIEARTE